jgi:hypothetical protein
VSRVDFVHNNNRFADVPFDAANGRLYIIAPSALLRTLAPTKMRLQVLSVEPDGDRTLGEYTLDHTGFAG